MYNSLQTPVVLLMFNRPHKTLQVLDAIRQARPTRLLVVADGPRPEHPRDVETCAATRALLKDIDWPCEVLTNFSDINLGCRNRLSSGLDWVFEIVEDAIILEDDCVPDPSFYLFCEELLRLYRNTSKVSAIAGANLLRGRALSEDSYYFSRYPLVWGWATWRRAWQHYDLKLKLWPRLRNEAWLNGFLQPREALYWTRIFDDVRTGANAWSYSFTFASWLQEALVVHPTQNLVRNIGFGADSTHTTDPECILADIPAHPMNFPLQHPRRIERHVEADDRLERLAYSGTLTRTIAEIHKVIRSRRDRGKAPSNGRSSSTSQPLSDQALHAGGE